MKSPKFPEFGADFTLRYKDDGSGDEITTVNISENGEYLVVVRNHIYLYRLASFHTEKVPEPIWDSSLVKPQDNDVNADFAMYENLRHGDWYKAWFANVNVAAKNRLDLYISRRNITTKGKAPSRDIQRLKLSSKLKDGDHVLTVRKAHWCLPDYLSALNLHVSECYRSNISSKHILCESEDSKPSMFYSFGNGHDILQFEDTRETQNEQDQKGLNDQILMLSRSIDDQYCFRTSGDLRECFKPGDYVAKVDPLPFRGEKPNKKSVIQDIMSTPDGRTHMVIKDHEKHEFLRILSKRSPETKEPVESLHAEHVSFVDSCEPLTPLNWVPEKEPAIGDPNAAEEKASKDDHRPPRHGHRIASFDITTTADGHTRMILCCERGVISIFEIPAAFPCHEGGSKTFAYKIGFRLIGVTSKRIKSQKIYWMPEPWSTWCFYVLDDNRIIIFDVLRCLERVSETPLPQCPSRQKYQGTLTPIEDEMSAHGNSGDVSRPRLRSVTAMLTETAMPQETVVQAKTSTHQKVTAMSPQAAMSGKTATYSDKVVQVKTNNHQRVTAISPGTAVKAGTNEHERVIATRPRTAMPQKTALPPEKVVQPNTNSSIPQRIDCPAVKKPKFT